MSAPTRRVHPSVVRRVAVGAAAVVVVAALAAVAAVVASGIGTSSGSRFPPFQPRSAPSGWLSQALPDGAVLSYPPSMRPVTADPGAASAAQLSPAGAYLLYLNATPRQSTETTASWAAFRLSHLRADDARSVHELAAAAGVRFLGGTGTCVLDSYLTRVGSHHYTELACLVHGRHASSVVVAAAATSNWSHASGLLERAVAAYRVR